MILIVLYELIGMEWESIFYVLIYRYVCMYVTCMYYTICIYRILMDKRNSIALIL